MLVCLKVLGKYGKAPFFSMFMNLSSFSSLVGIFVSTRVSVCVLFKVAVVFGYYFTTLVLELTTSLPSFCFRQVIIMRVDK